MCAAISITRAKLQPRISTMKFIITFSNPQKERILDFPQTNLASYPLLKCKLRYSECQRKRNYQARNPRWKKTDQFEFAWNLCKLMKAVERPG